MSPVRVEQELAPPGVARNACSWSKAIRDVRNSNRLKAFPYALSSGSTSRKASRHGTRPHQRGWSGQPDRNTIRLRNNQCRGHGARMNTRSRKVVSPRAGTGQPGHAAYPPLEALPLMPHAESGRKQLEDPDDPERNHVDVPDRVSLAERTRAVRVLGDPAHAVPPEGTAADAAASRAPSGPSQSNAQGAQDPPQ